MKNSKGFTLIEMMIVLLVISILLIITIPNVTKHNSNINNKGCEALLNMIDGQVQAYRIDHKGKSPVNVDELVEEKYLNEGSTTCPDGAEIILTAEGADTKSGEESQKE